jgi:hypothetical protein
MVLVGGTASPPPPLRFHRRLATAVTALAAAGLLGWSLAADTIGATNLARPAGAARAAQASVRAKASDSTPPQQQHRSDDPGMDFWWMSALHSNPSTVAKLSFESPRQLVLPPEIQRVWIDVGVNAKSDFLLDLDKPGGNDLFVLGYEPSPSSWKPCPHPRCAVVWAAATPAFDVVRVNVQDGADLCNSLLRPNAGTTSRLWRGCVTQRTQEDGVTPLTVQAPGVPLSEMIRRVPREVEVEYVKIDAQGYDLEVMKGLLGASERVHVVSLEAMDVQDRSKLLYEGQPTLDDIRAFLESREANWKFVKSVGNDGALGEVNAFFVFDENHASKVDRLAQVLMGNKEGRGESP